MVDAFYATLRRLLDEELPARDGTQRAMFRAICEGTRLRLALRSDATIVLTRRSSEDGLVDLVAGTTVPSWRAGWGRFARDEILSDAIAMYFDRMTIYVARSRFLNCTAAIALAYGVDSTFQYGSWSAEWEIVAGAGAADTLRRSGTQLSSPPDAHLDLHLSRFGDSPRQRYFATLATSLNALDPYIHRILYCYVRALRLRNAEFWEDAVTSLDAAVVIAAALVRDRLGDSTGEPYEAMVSTLRLGDRTDSVLGHLRDLRNYFGAHPAEAGFWDFPDDYGDTVEEMFPAVRQLIWAASRFEAAHRRVEPLTQSSWSDWFREHAGLLSDIVWFRLDAPRSGPLSSAATHRHRHG